MTVTIKDIAKACNVSYSTVSRVLNSKYVRKTEKTEEILAVAKSLGYKPNKIAVQLVKNKTNMIGLLIPDIANPHYPEITKWVEDAAGDAGYQVFLCNTDWDANKEIAYRDSLIEKRVAGLIVMPVSDESHTIFKGLNVPVVFLGSRTEEPDISYVVMDNVKAAFDATEHLILKGHRNLAYIGRKVTNFTSSDRSKGFEMAIEKYKIPKKNTTIIQSDSYNLEGGYRATKRLLEAKNPPTAIVAFSDFLAIGVIQAIEEKDLIVGQDVAVVGFDDILFSGLQKISLTTFTPMKQDLARKSVDIILHKNEYNIESRMRVMLSPKLIERTTSGNSL